MMKQFWISGVCAAFMAVAPAHLGAQEAGASNVQRMALSMSLFDYGIAENDAVSLVTAASIRKAAQLTEGPIGEPDTPLEPGQDPLSWQDMLAEAEARAQGRADLLGLIEDVRAATTKGLIDGAIISKSQVAPRGSRSYSRMVFEGGKFAEIYSEGRGEENLDMFVYDSRGAVVCSQTDQSPISLCGWTPPETTAYRVVVQNRSDRTAFFSLMTN
ncbi:MAG: hypothetical protein AAF744_10830 [Pseudomonadota bacterium]